MINYDRLARAMNTSPLVLHEMLDQEHFVSRWFLSKCALCGKAELKHGEFIAQFDGIPVRQSCTLVYSVCRDHGGLAGREYFDCLTGESVKVLPSPSLLLKAIKDPLLELLYWAGVWRRYCASFVWDGLWALRHPLRYWRYRKTK